MRTILILNILLTTYFSYAQNKINYLGSLILDNNIISLKLMLEEHNGVVNGFSITNIGTENETKSKITGIYFKSDRSFQLQEREIVYTKSAEPLNTFCHISMYLSFKGLINKKLKGTFTGKFLDDTECARGEVILMQEKRIQKKIQTIKKKIHKKNKKDNNNKPLLEPTKILKNGDNITLKWEDKDAILLIWDPNKEDQDKIEIRINNKTILYNFETKKKKKKIIFKLEKGENTLEIIAVSTGKLPPNTSRVELIDSKTKYSITTQLEIGKSAVIKIIR